MLNDQEASQIISKSMTGTLSSEEQKQIDEHLQNDPDSAAYVKLSTAIHESVAGVASASVSGESEVGPGLSDAARNRLNDSVISALKNSSVSSSGDGSEWDPALARTMQSSSGSASTRQPEVNEPPQSVPASSELMHAASKSGDIRESKSRYKLIRKLGEGGLGRVWLARDEKLNRNVALKEMNQSALQLPKAWQRFNREAEITGQLEHPNVVSLYEYGNDSRTGEPFYAMRFVGKRTLADAIEDYHDRCKDEEPDPLVLHRLLSSFLDVCQAIAYAHSRGVIHRDLKPENVALDNFGQVMVLDWGLAKLTDDGELGVRLSGTTDISDRVLAQTMADEVIGTPLYMAPEQAAGQLDSVDKLTDVYGLGAILFAILTGQAPHQASHISSGGNLKVQSILEAIAKEDSPRPRDYRDSVPLELERICQQAMAFKKYARYESAADLATDVERWMADQGVRQSQYESLRLDGRELRNNVQAAVRDLETNVRFMSKLPPIQELIRSDSEENTQVWRDRLSTIFQGLLNAKSDFRSVGYIRVDGDEYKELVRVDRHSTDHSTIRSIPRSRLRTGTLNECGKQVIDQNPDEVFTSLACGSMCGSATNDRPNSLALIAGVPVFDETTEEVFGVIMIECDLHRVLKEQLNRRFTAKHVVVACDTFQIIMHSDDAQGIVSDHAGQPLLDVMPEFKAAQDALQTRTEFIDETDRLVYGARLWLIPKKHGIMFLLSQ